VDSQQREQDDEQDRELVAFLRQFSLRTPPTFKGIGLRRLATARNLGIAAAVLLAIAVPLRFSSNQGTVQKRTDEGPPEVQQRNSKRAESALSRAMDLMPSVETTLSAFAPPATPQDHVNVALPAAPRRKVIARVKPAYPAEAQRLGLEAYVVLRLTVNRAGDVTKTERITGVVNLHPDEQGASDRAEFYAANPYAFALAAEAAATQWKFEPAVSSMTCFASFTFSLQPGPDLTKSPPLRPPSGTLVAVPGSSQPGLPVPKSPQRVDGQTIKPPVRLVNVNPVYPEDAQAARVAGVVLLQITIGTDGSVVNAVVLRSIPMLDQAAIDAVLQWMFEPTLLNGVPIEVKSVITVNFTLQ
jgi:TonB family protein